MDLLDNFWWKTMSFIGNLCHMVKLTPEVNPTLTVNLSMTL
jgi:hypothetical protein